MTKTEHGAAKARCELPLTEDRAKADYRLACTRYDLPAALEEIAQLVDIIRGLTTTGYDFSESAGRRDFDVAIARARKRLREWDGDDYPPRQPKGANYETTKRVTI